MRILLPEEVGVVELFLGEDQWPGNQGAEAVVAGKSVSKHSAVGYWPWAEAQYSSSDPEVSKLSAALAAYA